MPPLSTVSPADQARHRATHAVRSFIRSRDFFKIASSLETGADHGMWTFQRYRSWLQNRKKWHLPNEPAEAPDSEPAGDVPPAPALPTAMKTGTTAALPKPAPQTGGRIEIEPEEGDWGKILKKDE